MPNREISRFTHIVHQFMKIAMTPNDVYVCVSQCGLRLPACAFERLAGLWPNGLKYTASDIDFSPTKACAGFKPAGEHMFSKKSVEIISLKM